MVAELRAVGWTVEVVPVDGSWPLPGLEDPSVLDPIPDGATVLADGLLWPGLGASGVSLAFRCRVVVLVHSLLSRETGLSPDSVLVLDAAERTALDLAAEVVATSELTREGLLGFGEPVDALPGVTVIIPGTNPAERARGGNGTRLLTVGTLTRRKGHDRLLSALAGVPGPWTLTCAGAARDPAWAALVARRASELGLGERVSFAGDLGAADLAALYATSNLVVQVAAYEAFGMAIAEAVARGLPVVTTSAGVVEHLPAGAVIEVDDDTVGPAVATLLADPDAGAAQADRAWARRSDLPTWSAQAARLAGRPPRRRDMSGFPAQWLAMREPYDHAARDPALVARLAIGSGAARSPWSTSDVGSAPTSDTSRRGSRCPSGGSWWTRTRSCSLRSRRSSRGGPTSGRDLRRRCRWPPDWGSARGGPVAAGPARRRCGLARGGRGHDPGAPQSGERAVARPARRPPDRRAHAGPRCAHGGRPPVVVPARPGRHRGPRLVSGAPAHRPRVRRVSRSARGRAPRFPPVGRRIHGRFAERGLAHRGGGSGDARRDGDGDRPCCGRDAPGSARVEASAGPASKARSLRAARVST